MAQVDANLNMPVCTFMNNQVNTRFPDISALHVRIKLTPD
jgi:hypothetical protein